MTYANRGKKLETDFAKICKEWQVKAAFAHHRFPDAKAGSRKTAPADFQTCYKSQVRLIEVKEVKEDNRLPYKNFDPFQVGRMRMWALAGTQSWVIVSHTESGLYRCFNDLSKFVDREVGGSWFFDGDGKNKNFVEPTFQSESLEEVFNFIHGM